MNSNEQIWEISKRRFLEIEAQHWLFSNKTLEIIFLAGIVIWSYFEFIYVGTLELTKLLGLVISIISLANMISRIGNYEGFYDGYEMGFKDASRGNLVHWDDPCKPDSIKLVLEKINTNEEKLSDEQKKMRAKEIQKGFDNLLGYLITWRKNRGQKL